MRSALSAGHVGVTDSLGFLLLLLTLVLYLSVVCSWKLRPPGLRSEEIRHRRLFSAEAVIPTTQTRRHRRNDEVVDREARWQSFWESNDIFNADFCRGNLESTGFGMPECPKFYGLCMIPYPSGEGLHVGHLLGYTALDVVCRYKRMQGYQVLCPIGWDSFGLPAERYAESVGRDVKQVTLENIARFKHQLKRMGFAFDWSRELATSDPGYYKWTQWMFQEFYRSGIAYRANQLVNWCPDLGTVLANEEVRNGLSARGGFPVYRKNAQQWLLRISQYAQRLLDGLDALDWPQSIIDAQKKWIGIEKGYKVALRVAGKPGTMDPLYLFVTDLDLLTQATHVEIPAETDDIMQYVLPENVSRVDELLRETSTMSNLERYDRKLCVETGTYILVPGTGTRLPLCITNTPMLFSHPINCRIALGQTVDGSTGNDNLKVTPRNPPNDPDACVTANIPDEDPSIEPFINVKMKDWVFSRSRYWGEPIPLVERDGSFECIPDLPLETSSHHKETMPQWAGSSWHYLRFCDARNQEAPFDRRKAERWMPVDLYIGGTEHAVSHLLYARFWNKLLFDLGLSPVEEPFRKIVLHGIIRSPSFSIGSTPVDADKVTKHKGRYVLKHDLDTEVSVKLEKMSKSRNNIVSPDDIIAKFGADALRMHLLFLGPIHKDKVWSDSGLIGVARLLDRITAFFRTARVVDAAPKSDVVIDQYVARITRAIEEYSFNVAIADFFKLFDYIYDISNGRAIDRGVGGTYIKLLAPFAPHIAEDLWHILYPDRTGSVAYEPFPKA
ncbi:tRNA synthetases class I family protein [Babesia bovis T2Bo]|uniref:leucine--tRNA ligase n=1 Tax=Babesia bovis TaxID=5865 RepID=A7AVK8_BABBO|nr:tRNA synthetases class I family protein [Babesia bovis T2Bo]EDO05834.1 tRNA synthetases class I family protein [Babesia bovis T2Bo]|eukprot:XP_001609402.1 leucyl-tRNA synthetase [Babesia bovis T2Bo]